MGGAADANRLYYGDNLPILREYFPAESVDLVYLDPPFNSNRSYSAIFADESGRRSDAQIKAFEDSWHWGPSAELHYSYLTNSALNDGAVSAPVSSIVAALRFGIRETPMLAYVVEMTVRLIELHRVLKPTGALWLHCDPTASSYLRVVLDAIFGPRNFRNEVTWKRSDSHNDARHQLPAVSDRILYYGKSPAAPFTPQFAPHADRTLQDWYQYLEFPDGTVRKMTREERETQVIPAGVRRFNAADTSSPNPRPNLMFEFKGYKPNAKGWRYSREKMEELDRAGLLLYPKDADGRIMLKRYLDEQEGTVIGDVWTDIPQLRAADAERLGWPTQKPVRLLERIIAATSEPGDVVLDPFCGCGTALVAAEKLGRKWLGIDITYLAIATMRQRLRDSFGLTDVAVIGQPTEVAGARMMAENGPDGRYQFQWWALDAIGAMPRGGDRKKGSDTGIDGRITFTGANGELKQAIVSVKSGKPKADDVRVLKAVVEREKAAIGILVSLDEPTAPMRHEATLAGTYTAELTNREIPRIQLLSAVDIIEGGKRPQLPPLVSAPYARAARVAPTVEQPAFFGE